MIIHLTDQPLQEFQMSAFTSVVIGSSSQFFMKLPYGDVRVHFSFQFLKFQNMYIMHFKIDRAYAPMWQNTTLVILKNYKERMVRNLQVDSR
jgi:hypothetical protein